MRIFGPNEQTNNRLLALLGENFLELDHTQRQSVLTRVMLTQLESILTTVIHSLDDYTASQQSRFALLAVQVMAGVIPPRILPTELNPPPLISPESSTTSLSTSPLHSENYHEINIRGVFSFSSTEQQGQSQIEGNPSQDTHQL